MNVPVLLHGSVATHRRGRILQEAFGARASSELPNGGAVVLEFGEAFQLAQESEQLRLIEWTRVSGRLILLLPPFATGVCERPVLWRAERLDGPPHGGQGLARVLAPEVGYRLEGKLQTPSNASWSDLTPSVGTYRLHPAAGIFAVTTLPLWSLTVLDAADDARKWLTEMVAGAGEFRQAERPPVAPLQPDHYGLLVFLLSTSCDDEDRAIRALCSSSIFRFSEERGRSLLNDLRERGLVSGITPSEEAAQSVMRSPYAPYVSALREVAVG